MAITLFDEFVLLFQMACVIFLFAYLFSKSRFYSQVLEHRTSPITQIFLAIVFGLLSVYGMSSGVSFYTATVNIRDFGPMIAGLACGPYVGIGAGIIGFAYRLYLGGTNVYAVAIAPLIAGIIGGLVYYFNNRELVSTKNAVLITFIVELFVSVIALLVRFISGDSVEKVMTVTINVAVLMIIMTTISAGVFCVILHNEIKERRVRKEKMQLELEMESKKNLNTIINTIAYPVYVIDRDHRFILVNDSMCRFVDLAREDILGKTHRDIYNKASADPHWDRVETAFGNLTPREEIITITKPDGQICTIISTSTIYTDTSGQKFMVWVIQDITDKKHAEEILRESEERFSNAFRYAPIGLALVSLDGHWLKVNHALCDMLGYSENELYARTFQDLIHPDDIETDLSYVRRLLAGEIHTYQMEKRYFHKSGQLIWTLLSVSLVQDQHRAPLYFISQIENITERKQAEDALAIVNRKLNLLNSISRHDILNQLTILLGFLNFSTKYINNPDKLQEFITKEVKSANTIRQQILFTRDYQDMGVKAPAWQSVSMSVVRAKGALNLENIEVVLDRSDLEVYADPLFDKVFYNLIDNALRYGGDSLKTIRVYCNEFKNSLTIVCEDDGAGIIDEDKIQLFMKGFGKNTGLGLFLTREILSITGITITENGRPGKGARFEITVPKGGYRFVGRKE